MNTTTRRDLSNALDRIAQEIGPHLGAGSVKRSLLERAFAKAGGEADPELRMRVIQALDSARIRILEDQADQPDRLPDLCEPPAASVRGARPAIPPEGSDPVAAGRRRLELDRLLPTSRRHRVLLTAEEEVGLSLIARPDGKPLPQGGFARLDGEAREAAEAMLLHNLRLAHSMARSYAGQGLEHDDLYSHAVIGLVRSVELFDPASGYKFSTYATHWLRQAVSRAIANESRTIRIPVHMWEVVRKVGAARERLTVDGVRPSAFQLASELHLDVDKVREAMQLLPAVMSLDAPLSDDQFTLGDLVAAQAHKHEHIEVHGIYPEDVVDLMEILTDREDDVLRRRFGLQPYDEPQVLDDIGKVYGVTRERIRQIESKAMNKVRAVLRERGHVIEVPAKKQLHSAGTDAPD